MKKGIAAIVGAALVAGAFFVATASADITITIPTTTKQDAQLVKVLAYLNQDREVPYATIDEALRDRLIRDAKQLIRVIDEKEHKNIYVAWEAANETTKDQIRALLGVQ